MNLFLQVVTAFILCVTSMKSVHADPPTPPLVTMSKAELMEIFDCIVKSPTKVLCDGYATCTVKKPDQVLNAYRQCRLELGDASKLSCNGSEQLYTPELNRKIFDCTASRSKQLDEEEKGKMIDFENCIKAFGAQCEASA